MEIKDMNITVNGDVLKVYEGKLPEPVQPVLNPTINCDNLLSLIDAFLFRYNNGLVDKKLATIHFNSGKLRMTINEDSTNRLAYTYSGTADLDRSCSAIRALHSVDYNLNEFIAGLKVHSNILTFTGAELKSFIKRLQNIKYKYEKTSEKDDNDRGKKSASISSNVITDAIPETLKMKFKYSSTDDDYTFITSDVCYDYVNGGIVVWLENFNLHTMFDAYKDELISKIKTKLEGFNLMID